jgi:uncharacterized protein
MSEYQSNAFPVSEEVLSKAFNSVMARVYLWMTMGLVVTTAVSVWVVNTPAVYNFVFSNFLVIMGLFILQIVMVVALVKALQTISTGAALAMFFAYAALMGVTLSSILLYYTSGTLSMAFGVAAIVFILMSVIGLVTKQDLTKWGPILFFGLIGIIIATLVNMFLRNSTLDLIISYIGVLLFMGLIVYDTKYIKDMTAKTVSVSSDGGAVSSSALGKLSVLGALKLYLDFINLFLFLLRIFGRR